ncbi:aquaporin-9-like [Saccoglossus kowalevskii]
MDGAHTLLYIINYYFFFTIKVFGTMLLVACIMAITDERNNKPPSGMEPFLIGLVVFVIGLSFGLNCGYAINPARDLSPRFFSYCVGYGAEVWTPYGINWWWVPIVGPLIGGVCGALVYITMIEAHHVNEDDVESYTINVDLGNVPGDIRLQATDNPVYKGD